MNKAILICEENAKEIEQALAAKNGRATSHVFSMYYEIKTLAAEAEQQLIKIGLVKAKRTNALYFAYSGEAVATAYGYTRTGNGVVLRRAGRGWTLLTDRIFKTELQKNGGSANRLLLTVEQDKLAIVALRRGYEIFSKISEKKRATVEKKIAECEGSALQPHSTPPNNEPSLSFA
jgi:hypothetical protein